MNISFSFRQILLTFIVFLLLPLSASAVYIHNPDEVKIDGLVSFGKTGAAWLSWNGYNMLVNSNFTVGTDLRVVAVRDDSVVLYRPHTKKYHILDMKTNLSEKRRGDVISTLDMPIWKIARMVAFAYRKDYISNYQISADNKVTARVPNCTSMMLQVVTPNHRFRIKDDIIYVSPLHVDRRLGLKYLMSNLKRFRSSSLDKAFPALNTVASLISDGKPFDHALQKIVFATNVRIIWKNIKTIPLYCSLKDRPWHEILENIVVFNGFKLTITSEGIEIR